MGRAQCWWVLVQVLAVLLVLQREEAAAAGWRQWLRALPRPSPLKSIRGTVQKLRSFSGERLQSQCSSLLGSLLRRQVKSSARTPDAAAKLSRPGTAPSFSADGPFGSSDVTNIVEPLKEQAQEYLSNVAWDFVMSSNGIEVFKAKRTLSDKKHEQKWPCFKTICVVNCSRSRLFDVLMDSNNIEKYSEWTASREEVERFDDDTAITWSRSKSVFGMKPHDFCTLSHTFNPDSHTTMILFQAIKHPKAPPQDDHTRSDVIFSLNQLKELPPEASNTSESNGIKTTKPRTELIAINHVCYTGVHPFLLGSRASQGIIDYMTKLSKFANG